MVKELPKPSHGRMRGREMLTRLPRLAAHALIRSYQLSLSALLGRWCRHLPTCSAYADEAIARHGLWAGGWMGMARLCRCNPWGTHGFDPVPRQLPEGADWSQPWRYGRWRGPLECQACDVTPPSAIPPAS